MLLRTLGFRNGLSFWSKSLQVQIKTSHFFPRQTLPGYILGYTHWGVCPGPKRPLQSLINLSRKQVALLKILMEVCCFTDFKDNPFMHACWNYKRSKMRWGPGTSNFWTLVGLSILCFYWWDFWQAVDRAPFKYSSGLTPPPSFLILSALKISFPGWSIML